MRVMQLRYGSCLVRKTTAHLAVGGIVTKNNLDCHAPTKCCALPSLIDGPHASYANAPHNIIVSELRSLERQHRRCLSYLATSQTLSRGGCCGRSHCSCRNYSRTAWRDCRCSGCSRYSYYFNRNMRGIW